MKTTAIAAILAALGLASMATAQDTGTINSGPWMMHRSTGNKAADRVGYMMDRTLNACERNDLTNMFRSMMGNTSYVLEKAICNAVDSYSKDSPTYSNYSVADWSSDNGMSDYQVFRAMRTDLRPEERLVLGQWLDNATDSQIMAVGKLIRCGGYANAMWMSTGMDNH